jgi:selenocysteine lyase/cysteine desulfurase
MKPLTRRSFLGATAGAVGAGALHRPTLGEPSADPLGVRADFPVTGQRTYLNSAYIGPSPLPVLDAGRAFLEAKSTRPIPLDAMVARTNEVRVLFAGLIGAGEEETGFLSSTSEGENVVVGALEWRAGDNVVLDDLHYTSSYAIYQRLAETRGVEIRIAPRRGDGSAPVGAFEPLVDDRTRLISLAWVSHQNGYRHDVPALARLAHAHQAYLYCDAIQAIGMFPVSMPEAGVDFLTCGTYKWLLAGFGVAAFFVKRELLDRVPMDRQGHLNIEKDLGNYRYQIFKSARKYEYATLAFGPLYQLGAALEYLGKIGVDRVESHAVSLAAKLRLGLEERKVNVLTPPGNRSSIVAFENPLGELERAKEVFEAAGVDISFREKGSQIRVAPALFNHAADVERLLEVVERLA